MILLYVTYTIDGSLYDRITNYTNYESRGEWNVEEFSFMILSAAVCVYIYIYSPRQSYLSFYLTVS